MTYGIRKGLEDIAYELKGIRNILASLWALQEGADAKGSPNPEAYADEYISTEECARRLGITDQTIRNWIAIGKKNKTGKGWIEGVHYVNINPGYTNRNKLRIPWNNLIRSFSKNEELNLKQYKDKNSSQLYRYNEHSLDVYLASLNKESDAEEDDTTGTSI